MLTVMAEDGGSQYLARSSLSESVGEEAAKSSCCAGECLAQCPLNGTSLLPSHVRSSKRETKPDVGLLPVLVWGRLSSWKFSLPVRAVSDAAADDDDADNAGRHSTTTRATYRQ